MYKYKVFYLYFCTRLHVVLSALAIIILVRFGVCHNPVPIQAQVR